MAGIFKNLSDSVLGLLFPDRCAGCGRAGVLLCDTCRAALRPYPDARLRTSQQAALEQILIAFRFEGALREAIHTLKYQRVRRMAEPLAELLVEFLRVHPLPVDGLIAVPLHRNRLNERGFNQSELLVQHLSERPGWPPSVNGLARSRDTAHQVGLDMHARQSNMQQAFVWQQAAPPPLRVLLIDDVVTTGATLNACAEALRTAGARQVSALVLARSLLKDR